MTKILCVFICQLWLYFLGWNWNAFRGDFFNKTLHARKTFLKNPHYNNTLLHIYAESNSQTSVPFSFNYSTRTTELSDNSLVKKMIDGVQTPIKTKDFFNGLLWSYFLIIFICFIPIHI